MVLLLIEFNILSEKPHSSGSMTGGLPKCRGWMYMWEKTENSFWLRNHTKPAVTPEKLVQYWSVSCLLTLQENSIGPELHLISVPRNANSPTKLDSAAHLLEREIFEILSMRFQLSMLLHWRRLLQGRRGCLSSVVHLFRHWTEIKGTRISNENLCHQGGRERTKTCVCYVL